VGDADGGGSDHPMLATFRRRPQGLRAIVVADLVAAFFISFVSSVEGDTIYLYLKTKLKVGTGTYIAYYMFHGSMMSVSLLLLLPLLRRFPGLHDTSLGVVGGVSRCVSLLILGSFSTPSLVYLVAVLGGFAKYLVVAERSIMSSLLKRDEQGRVFTVV
ncbi:hypothetical protein OTU49_000325, partial [Cherax quadricarinatus]